MAKSKALTPQEIYKQRRQREEAEKTAYLPPGLINHGNTCFMNSVLQGLIATRLLSDLVHFNLIPPEIQATASTPIVSRRSPQLTNGHNLAGIYEQPWVNSMPIGDMFLTVMYKAWDSQAARRRDVLSPRPILATLGQKYDQYLDFAQQDAHEFLRILLDAMRMEEQDIIKKRQPPPSHPKKRRRTTITPDSLNTPTNESMVDSKTEPPLLSFADMIFGGELTSILVCQKCKHVSQTYEDFNDISLSIKAEDYFPHNRKRDRFKKMVGKLTQFPGSSAKPQTRLPISAVEMLRSSSVPPSPRTERDAAQLLTEHPRAESPRRRSLDLPVGGAVSEPESPVPAPPPPAEVIPEVSAPPEPAPDTPSENDVAVESDSNPVVHVTGPEEKHVEFIFEPAEKAESSSAEKEKVKEKAPKNDDMSWAKIGRRISLTVGLGRSKGNDKEKDKKERDRKSRSMDRRSLGVPDAIKEDVSAELAIQKSQSASASLVNTPASVESSALRNRVLSDSAASSLNINGTESATTSSATIPLSTPPSNKTNIPTAIRTFSVSSVPSTTRSSSPQPSAAQPLSNLLNVHPTSIFPGVQRSKSPKPPKSSPAEVEYLRKILADVSTAPSSSNPFAMFKPPMLHSHSSHHGSRPMSSGGLSSTGGERDKERNPGAAWLGLGRNLTGIEECMRLFTAVEVLDGDNMVGCRRCWKIQHGMLHTSKGKDSDHEEEDEESQEPSRSESPTPIMPPTEEESGVNGASSHKESVEKSRPQLTMLAPTPTTLIPTSLSTPTVSFYSSIAQPSDTRSVSSLPTESSTAPVDESGEDSPLSWSIVSDASDQSKPAGPGGLPIPKISTTAPPETPTDSTVSVPSRVISTGSTSSERNPSSTATSLSSQPQLARVIYGSKNDSASKDSLDIPRRRHKRRSVCSDATTTDVDSSDDESDTSVDTSVSTESSKKPAGVNGPPNTLTTQPSTSQNPSNASPPSHKKPSKPKPVIMRPAYKRYLIATPPPILVIHLKRFQQTSKTPFVSFSHGFKKLDDYVSFPEYLDLLPFLAPRKEDYGLGKKGKDKEKKIKKEERCMYRLYAVVVHIGNMLGGHYVAYTALPSESPLAPANSSSGPPDPTPSTTSTDPSSSASTSGKTASTDHSHPHAHSAKPSERQWAHISDTNVRLATLEEVLHAKAYLCMYDRC